MGEEQYDLEAQVAAEWARFEGRLADRLAGMEDDEIVRVQVLTGVDEDELEGAAPYLQFLAWDDDNLRAEVAGNGYLDERYALSGDDCERLVDAGWCSPNEETEELNFFVNCELRDADRVAMMSVAALREVFGCPHPSFLSGNLDVGTTDPVDDLAEVDEEPVTYPQGRDHLQQLVDQALTVLFGSPAEHDEDGDLPVTVGMSRLFVRVCEDRPAVDLFAHIVLGIQDTDRLPLELEILNRAHPAAKFHVAEDRVVMRQQLIAHPFVPDQLRAAVSVLCNELDDLARDLATRVGGRRFLQGLGDPPTSHEDLDPAGAHPSLVGLLEMLHDGEVAPAEVAALFDHDRHELVCQLVRLRTGAQSSAPHDLEDVLDHLRGALRFIVERQARAELAADWRAARRRSQQLALMPEPEHEQATLDSGRWDQEVS